MSRGFILLLFSKPLSGTKKKIKKCIIFQIRKPSTGFGVKLFVFCFVLFFFVSIHTGIARGDIEFEMEMEIGIGNGNEREEREERGETEKRP